MLGCLHRTIVARRPRLFTFTELRDWLLAAGFTDVDGYGDDATPLSPPSRRLIVTAQLNARA
jgi:hypothetical protein